MLIYYTMRDLGKTLIPLLKQYQNTKNDNTMENNTTEYIRIHNFT